MFDFGISWLKGALCDSSDPFGGESFIQLIAGTNFVFFAFRELDPRKGVLINKVKQIRDATILTIKDRETLTRTDIVVDTVCDGLKYFHDLLWTVCRPLALLTGLVGVFFLFIGVHGVCTMPLAFPLGVYLAACLMGTLFFSCFCRFVTWRCNTKRPDVKNFVAESKAALGSQPNMPDSKKTHQ